MSRLAAEMPGLAQLITPTSTPAPPVVPVNPAIGASPTSLAFTAQQGGGNPTAQTVTIRNTGGETLNWSASASTNWLSVNPASGTGTGTATVTIGTAALTAGTYSGVITISATDATSITVPVTFTVTAAPVPPAISANPTALSFTATQGGANPAPQTLSISNTGGGTLSWTASENATWLMLSPASGTGNGSVTLTVTTGSLPVGSNTGTVTLSGGTGVTPVTVPVTFTIAAAPVPTAIGASPTSFSFTATQGAANPTAQVLSIRNLAGGTLTWSITDNQSWLTLNATSGTTTTETDPVTVSVNTNGLQAATHTATITVTATGASNTPQTIPVTLTLSPPATASATLTWNPNTEPDLASYRVYRSTNQGVYGAAIATVPAGTVSYTATGLPVGQTYYFTITAVDSSDNESPFSNEVNKSIP
jgi:hypothetical protein